MSSFRDFGSSARPFRLRNISTKLLNNISLVSFYATDQILARYLQFCQVTGQAQPVSDRPAHNTKRAESDHAGHRHGHEHTDNFQRPASVGAPAAGNRAKRRALWHATHRTDPGSGRRDPPARVGERCTGAGHGVFRSGQSGPGQIAHAKAHSVRQSPREVACRDPDQRSFRTPARTCRRRRRPFRHVRASRAKLFPEKNARAPQSSLQAGVVRHV